MIASKKYSTFQFMPFAFEGNVIITLLFKSNNGILPSFFTDDFVKWTCILGRLKMEYGTIKMGRREY